MTRASVCLFAALLCAAGGQARADLMWNYDWTPQELNSIPTAHGGVSLVTQQGGTVLTNLDGVPVANVPLSVSAITAIFAPGADGSDSIGRADYAYQLKIQVGDDSATFDVAGFLSGSFNATSSTLDNTFTSELSQAKKIGENLFSVVLGPYLNPTLQNGILKGELQVQVGISAAGNGGGNGGNGGNGPGPVSQVPEPTALLLAGLALPALVGLRMRRPA